MGNELRGVQKSIPSGNQRNYLRFHEVHGDNIKLMKSASIACRKEGFCKGLVFSHRAVCECEPVCIKFLDISLNWSGALRIGFTMHDPVSIKSKLPKYACPDLVSTNGNWAKAIAERIAKKDAVLYFYFDMNGDVHYGVDSEELGIFLTGVNTSEKLWAVIDIYGNTEAIELVDPATLNKERFAEAYTNLTKLSKTRIAECNQNIAIELLAELNTRLSFHALHGKTVQMKMSNTVVFRKPGESNFAYAFIERYLESGEKIGVQVVQTNENTQGHFYYGITVCDPANLAADDLPKVPDDLLDRKEYWVAQRDDTPYEINDIIMFNFSSEGELTVIKNGYQECCQPMHVDLSQPLWLFFHFGGSISEARLLGSSVSDISTDILKSFGKLKTISSEGDSSCSDKKSSSECVVCCENAVDCALYRCGHMCMCYECALKIYKSKENSECPICRVCIQDVMKIYK